ncbi:MAG: metallophosphoesterase [Gemmatimonadota bacterium]|jgi:predicted MPP superfamily phosphohydrolase|nr:metallophosphoesterase [Gemmatimonadota bacterium]
MLAITGCGSEAAPSETPVSASPPESTNPLDSIRPDELYGVSPARNISLQRYELEVPGLPLEWSGARFAILSDMHLGLWEGNQEVAAAAVQAAVDAEPDVILLVGDYIDQGDQLAALQQVLAPLKGHETLAVLGDHDIRTDSVEAAIRQVLKAAGVRVLSNESVSLQRGDASIRIAGLDPAIIRKGWEEQKYIISAAGERGRTPILMSHLPAMATRSPRNRYPITVSGGVFCGDLEVPGTPRLSWLQGDVFPNAHVEGLDRLFRVMGSTVLVTCGVGYGFIPLRYGAAPEVTLLTIVPLGGSAGTGAALPTGEPAAIDSLLNIYQSVTDTTTKVIPATEVSGSKPPGAP